MNSFASSATDTSQSVIFKLECRLVMVLKTFFTLTTQAIVIIDLKLLAYKLVSICWLAVSSLLTMGDWWTVYVSLYRSSIGALHENPAMLLNLLHYYMYRNFPSNVVICCSLPFWIYRGFELFHSGSSFVFFWMWCSFAGGNRIDGFLYPFCLSQEDQLHRLHLNVQMTLNGARLKAPGHLSNKFVCF